MTRTRRALLGAAGPLAVAGLAGCLGSGATDGTTTTAGTTTATRTPRASVQVGVSCSTAEGTADLSPALVWVEPGGTVTWVTQSHCAQRIAAFHPDYDRPRRIPDGAAPFRSDYLRETGATYEHTFETEGVYDYAGLYAEDGQVGTVVVGRPDPSGQPGLAAPQDSLPDPVRERLRDLNEQARAVLD